MKLVGSRIVCLVDGEKCEGFGLFSSRLTLLLRVSCSRIVRLLFDDCMNVMLGAHCCCFCLPSLLFCLLGDDGASMLDSNFISLSNVLN